MKPKLFYSYSHIDTAFREDMERSLTLLRRNGLIEEWHDQMISPGRKIREEIRAHIDEADILVYLVSWNFISSCECRTEWEYGVSLNAKDKPVYCVPVILTDCSWIDLMGHDDFKALPDDGMPIACFEDANTGWLQVYNGIKTVANELRSLFKPKPEFLREINRSSFLSQEELELTDLYVFLDLAREDAVADDDETAVPIIRSYEELLELDYAIIHGEEKSGKTALVRHLYMTLQENNHPVLLMDTPLVHGRRRDLAFSQAYAEQYFGDYAMWRRCGQKILIVDDITNDAELFQLIEMAMEEFSQIILTAPSEMFYSYFRDEARLSAFHQLRLEPLSFVQQEQLIRKHLHASDSHQHVSDGLVDRIEDRVNSIVISGAVVPRFPFYVLSVLQTYESYMPVDMSISSYGHCYQALIVAKLVKSGISHADESLNACFNFAEHLAFSQFRASRSDDCSFDMKGFVERYRDEFVIAEGTVNRLSDPFHGIIDMDGTFGTEYIYYYFLGRALARKRPEREEALADICMHSYRPDYHLSLLFTIHHTNDISIIEDILLRTMVTVEDLAAAALSPNETRRFNEILIALPREIVSSGTVEANRARERAARDLQEEDVSGDSVSPDFEGTEEARDSTNGLKGPNAIYRVLKNTRLLGQVLRNQYGTLEKERIEEIVGIVADSGLRLINILLADEKQITALAVYLSEKHEEWTLKDVRRGLAFLSFQWSMVVIQQIVEAINVPEIRELVERVVEDEDSPVYDLIGYFCLLSWAPELTWNERRRLAALLDKHGDVFIQRVVSLHTQRYLNTHRSSGRVEQSVYALLGLRYRPRMLRRS